MIHVKATQKKVKCVIWDLDETLWNGTLTEDENVWVKKEIIDIIIELDKRGILNTIASKNNYEDAIQVIMNNNLEQYFLVPQINYGAKSKSVENIVKLLNLGIDSMAFIDDQQYELDEVNYSHPEVFCIQSEDVKHILDLEPFNPLFVTEDSAMRRQLYFDNLKRQKLEEEYEGPQNEFLKSLQMVFTIKLAEDTDLRRAEELVVRTNQLNSTGITYSYEDLLEFQNKSSYKLYVCELKDKYGTYGKIGIALVEEQQTVWNIKLLLFSCRVMTRGVGNGFISYLVQKAKEKKVSLKAEFVDTGRNRVMYITYKMAGFEDIECSSKQRVLEYKGDYNCNIPEYLVIYEGDKP